MSSRAAVVIPVYKEDINELEQISLSQVRKVLGKYPLIFVAPEGKNFSYVAPSDKVVHFSPQFFKNVQTYSQLLMSPFFYEAFKDFEYILIYQLDAFVFYDALEYFCLLGYDYIGAPWPLMYRNNVRVNFSCVGNGGFSLRNVKSHHNLLLNHSDLIAAWHARQFPEDVFFSYCGKRGDCDFRVAPIDIAYKFSAEFNPIRVTKKNGGKLPFGCHAWHNHHPAFYIEVFRQFGYDLLPLQNMLIHSDGGLRNWLTNVALQRLNRRLNHGHSLMRYLPRKNFASVRVVRSPFAMMILARILLENPTLADVIHLYEESDRDILIGDLTLKKEPHLIIDLWNADEFLISSADKKGISYGKRVVSFWREYLTRCEELFHNLGK